MKLLTAVAALGLALLLAACSPTDLLPPNLKALLETSVTNPLDDRVVAELGNGLGTAQAAVVAYAALPLCPKGTVLTAGNWCHDKALLKTLDSDMHAAVTAYGQLVDFQRTHPKGSTIFGGTLGQLYSQAKGAIDALTSIINAYKIGSPS